MKKGFVAVGLCLFFCANAMAVRAIPAFPTAEGYGAITTGGRGGAVYEVNNLNDSGTGSLRWAIDHNEPRTVVFSVSGTIYLMSTLKTDYNDLTIAGQTAPGDGITLAGDWLKVNSSNIIIRYIRCRLGDIRGDGTLSPDEDAIGGRYEDRIIVDHVTASWSIDETFSFYVNTNFTAQWCMITESLYRSQHYEEGQLQNHGYGGIWGSTNSSWHHNLLAHHSSRTPRIDGEITNNVDLRNNVIYNWGGNSCYGGEKATVNIVNCYYKYGPATASGNKRYRICNPSYLTVSGSRVYGRWYVAGNYVWNYPSVIADNWNGGVQPQGGLPDIPLCRSTTPFSVATTYPVTEQSALSAYNYVLNNAGCSIVRDSVDTRIIGEVETRTATYGGYYGAAKGIIDSQETVGGWPTLNSLPAPADTDHDGMPDEWETTHGLNPNDPADQNDYTASGYTNLEIYINGLCPDPYAPTPNRMTWAQEPNAIDLHTITMTATTAADISSGVEYYFANLTIPDHNSGWQDSVAYVDAGLTENITYTYQVKARNKSSNHNETMWSQPASAITSTSACIPVNSDLDKNCQVDFQDYIILAGAWASELPDVDLNGDAVLDWLDILTFAEDWLTCNRIPAEECWQEE